ncbi:MAG: glycosyltransferase family 87 protein, partial [Flavobacteriales bacterium]
MQKVITFLEKRNNQFVLIFLITLFITIQKFFLGTTTNGITAYNNYIIFKQSFFHFFDSKDLYILYPSEHYDLFKYSPTFAIFMGVLAYLPDFIALFLWNFLNVFVLYYALKKMPYTQKHSFLYVAVFILIEVFTTTQNSQSNALLTGMIILGYLALQNKKAGLAALLIIGTAFIKLFGIVALALFLFYPNKIKSALYVAFWTLVLGFIPLIFIPFGEFIMQYESWLLLLRNDHSSELKFSIMGFLHSWFQVPIDWKTNALIIGVIIFCIPLLRFKSYHIERFRILFVSNILMWVVLFNHMAESATFIIAVAGVGIWYFTK